MKKFNKEDFFEKVRKHSGEIIVALVALVLLIALLSISVPFLSDFFNRGAEEPTEPSHEHSYIVDNTVNPTCTEQGYSVYLCDCGDTYKDDYTDALGHDWNEWTVVTPATEDAEGTEKRVCKRNDAEEERSIDKLKAQPQVQHEHSYSKNKTVDPTCTEKGYSVYVCGCGDTYKADYKDALGHKWSSWVVTKAATEDEEGTETRTCGRCGITESRSIDKLPHSHAHGVDSIIKPTCTEKGYTVYICKCGDTYKADYTDPLGHEWSDWVVTKAATEDEEGTETRTCKRCGITENRSIDKLPHTHVHSADHIVKPTCTEKGYTVYVCKCGDTYKADYKDALGHDWDEWTVVKPATEDAEGLEKRVCKRNDAEEERSIDKLPHSHAHGVDSIIKPTCTEKGYTVYRCSCGDTYNSDFVDPLGHDWNEWTVVTPATEDAEGTEKRVCKRNDAEEERSIDKLSHSHSHTVDEIVEPTCTEQGYTVYHCGCGDTYKADYTNELGHDWGEWVVVIPPTDRREGIEHRECNRCDAEEDRFVEKETWEPEFLLSGQNTWTDGENIYFSSNAQHYVFKPKTKTWVKKEWNGLTKFFGSHIWFDGENVYLANHGTSYSSNYVLNKKTNTWVKKEWEGFHDICDDCIYSIGGKFYCTHNNQIHVFNKEADIWELVEWKGVQININGTDSAQFWTDGENLYSSYLTNHYVLNGDTWETKTWNGLTSFNGNNIWTDGENIYYSSLAQQYVLNKETDTWEAKVWYGLPGAPSTGKPTLDGYQVWTDGTNIYYSAGTRQYLLNKETDTWEAITWNVIK